MTKPSPRAVKWITRSLAALSIPVIARLLLWVGPVAAPLWHSEWGNKPAPGLLYLHAELIIEAELGYPRSLEGLVPPPKPGSNHEFQLKGMGWWSGGSWTEKAKGMGIPTERGLRLDLGKLRFNKVEEITPPRDYNGPILCQVDYQVRWEAPEDKLELLFVRDKIGLGLPKGLQVDQAGHPLPSSQQVTLEKDALGWHMKDAEALRMTEAGTGPHRRWLAALL